MFQLMKDETAEQLVEGFDILKSPKYVPLRSTVLRVPPHFVPLPRTADRAEWSSEFCDRQRQVHSAGRNGRSYLAPLLVADSVVPLTKRLGSGDRATYFLRYQYFERSMREEKEESLAKATTLKQRKAIAEVTQHATCTKSTACIMRHGLECNTQHAAECNTLSSK